MVSAILLALRLLAADHAYRASDACTLDSRARGGSPDLDCEMWEDDAPTRLFVEDEPKAYADWRDAIEAAHACTTPTSWAEQTPTAWIAVCGDADGTPLSYR